MSCMVIFFINNAYIVELMFHFIQQMYQVKDTINFMDVATSKNHKTETLLSQGM